MTENVLGSRRFCQYWSIVHLFFKTLVHLTDEDISGKEEPIKPFSSITRKKLTKTNCFTVHFSLTKFKTYFVLSDKILFFIFIWYCFGVSFSFQKSKLTYTIIWRGTLHWQPFVRSFTACM